MEQTDRKDAQLNLSHLDDSQRYAVRLPSSAAVIILAPPGSGKTTTVCWRIARFVHEDAIPAERVLALTFSNHACHDMRLKLMQLASSSAMQLVAAVKVCTFHGWALGVLRKFNLLPPEISIWDRRQMLAAIKLAMGQYYIEAGEDNPDISAQDAKDLLRTISLLRLRLVDCEQLLPDTLVREVWWRYSNLKASNQAVDFDDLLEMVVRTAQSYPQFREHLLLAYDYVFVDEVSHCC